MESLDIQPNYIVQFDNCWSIRFTTTYSSQTIGSHRIRESFQCKTIYFSSKFFKLCNCFTSNFQTQIAYIKECHPNPQHSSWSLSYPCVVCMLSEIRHLAALALNYKVAEAVRSCKNTHFLLYW